MDSLIKYMKIIKLLLNKKLFFFLNLIKGILKLSDFGISVNV
jgi:hypothetical protein